MRTIINIIWTCFCILAAAGLIGALLGLKFQSWPLAITGAASGVVVGWLFARFVSPAEFILEFLD